MAQQSNNNIDNDAFALMQKANQCMMQQEYSGVEDLLNKSLKLYRKQRGIKSIEYAEVLSMQGWYYSVVSNFAAAEKAILEATKTATQIAPTSYTTGKIFNRAFLAAFQKQDFTRAKEYCTRAIEILKKSASPTDKALIEARGNRAILLSNTSKINEAEEEIIALLPIIEQNFGKKDYTYPILLSTLAGIYAYKGESGRASSLFEESVALIKESVGEESETYFNLLGNLSMIYLRENQLEKAESLLVKSLDICKKMFGEQSNHYIKGINNLAVLHQSMGNELKAAELFFQAAELSKQLLGEAAKSHILALCNLANSSFKLGLKEDALNVAEMVNELLLKYNLSEKAEFIEIAALNNVIIICCGKTSTQLELRLASSAEKLKSIFGVSNKTYQNILNRLTILHIEKESYETALNYAIANCQSTELDGKGQTLAHLLSMINKGVCYYKLNLWNEAEQTFSNSLEIVANLMKNNLPFMSDSQREEYWVSIRKSLLIVVDFVGYAIANKHESSALNKLIYNYKLLSSPILLNYSTNLQKTIINSGDNSLIAVWQELNALKGSKSYNSIRAEELNKQLAIGSKAYMDYQNIFSIRWNDIKNRLSKDEAAIEIISIASENPTKTIDRYYAGLILRSDFDSPKIVVLSNAATTDEVLQAPQSKGKELYSLLFEPMEKELREIKTVYLATEDAVNTVSFSTMKHDSGYLIDKYSICNLLSTKEIIYLDDKRAQFSNANKSIALFGGADFGLPSNDLATADSVSVLFRGQGFDYLPGSKKEVTYIAEKLSKWGWKTALYVDKKATKSQFQLFSSHAPSVIHISTHGYYLTAPNQTTDSVEPNSSFKTSTDPMVRSGLLFSGANNAWNSSLNHKHSADNGILTSYDISMMNLNNTHLVVLSACNTALGDIDYWEGIYGLQRAFRIAGVGSMLVALWEIPDIESTMFMKLFYDNIITGKSLRESFNKAMLSMRNNYPNNPEIWAGFILIE